MEWYRLTLDVLPAAAGRIELDLRRLHICNAIHVCSSAPLSLLPGMFPTLAASTLWSSLAFAGLVIFQAGARLLTGHATTSVSKLGYVFALSTIATVAATVYLFGPETEGPSVAQLTGTLHRTWAPLTLFAGLFVGFAALYLAVAPESSDMEAEYKPITLGPARATPGASAGSAGSAGLPRPIERVPSGQIPPIGADGTPSDPIRALLRPGEEIRAIERTSGPIQPLQRISGPIQQLPRTSDSMPVLGRRDSIQPVQAHKLPTGSMAPIIPTPNRTRSEPLPMAPLHLRNRIAYVAITAELTSGGVDSRREDGSSRLVLWRDVVGVVARRMPDEYDGTTFVDIISTAGSTLRILPWTRLTGAPIEDGAARPRGLVERVVAMCPGARLDPATRKFLETGEAAQLPDLETLQAHDTHLA
jgi:hypothetical protein